MLSVPHSGTLAPDGFSDVAYPGVEYDNLEDPFLDRLLPDMSAIGLPALVSRYTRAYVDPNRSPQEWDPAMFRGRVPVSLTQNSARMRAGLGTFPRYARPHRPVNRRKLSLDQGLERLAFGHRPYHKALARLVTAALARFGYAILLDLHSMPHIAGQKLPDLILGDGFGRTCRRIVLQTAAQAAEAEGLRVSNNYPYAGGHIARTTGAPDHGIHALQLEFARDLYMDEPARRLTDGARLTAAIAAIVHAVAQIEPEMLVANPIALAGED